jgi:hypothetical protein
MYNAGQTIEAGIKEGKSAPKVQTGVKQAVRVLAHTSAWVIRQGDDFC